VQTAPFDVMRLAVGGGHRLHVEQYGRPDGLPALVLHGGPGSGSSPRMTLPFELKRWRVVLFDQRGAGRSKPLGGIEYHLQADLVCRPESSWLAREKQPHARLQWIDVGHDPYAPPMLSACRTALRVFARHGYFRGLGA
jgi:pimeloyl-ACP methyl ester carboxylesterase